ncbi:MAG: branched-chain amino acid aminotransferase [Saprospiraceae bacterium]|nr:branched-chain amino acid aminotransferase [Bacteroidia bacterium]NNE14715.1 branched-chain amino acid aminotransferase [Saprospiraceae bacterium]NNL93749.1 branched-chain amino acid aminotransferase [Saprospiraceae bacterium]
MDTSLKIIKNTNSKLHELDFDNIPFGRAFSDHMYVADYKDGAWGDMRIEPFGNFSVHPANIAWHYGQSIFEGMKATKAIDGTPMLFRPEMHAKRINTSARRMCMPEFPEDAFLEAVYELVKLEQAWIPKKEGSALYLRPYMVAMDEFIGVQVAKTYKFVIFCCPVGPYYSKAVKLKADDKFIRAAEGGTGEAKAAGNYAGSLYPAQIAKQEGYDQIMWLDAVNHKRIQEVGTMNIFFVINDTIVTPPTSGTILKGITRDSALTIFEQKGYNIEVRDLTIDEVMKAGHDGSLKEVFGTGTAAVVANVKEIGYQGDTITLNPESYTVSPFLKDTINGIRSTRIEDVNGWTVKVV